ncbi:hypothetical protein DPMN_035682 [Dreissena polymorpha]|uniref:Uncharacterized protein n=1 Tax=Dreissena polymorpha TaxID=45954 RepID=A0A9D4MA43_DREPO|nr:hypothetical protein DPMN_035682 [Dreissena polymorpha]
MDMERLRELVLQLIDMEPALVFNQCEDVVDGQPPVHLVPSSTPSWCNCGNCREMHTELERKCWGCLPRNCIPTREARI